MVNNKSLIILPTLNEKKNILKLFDLFKNYNLLNKFNFLFIDDCSKDGTRAYIKNICLNNKNHHFIFKNKRHGIGKAHIDGILWGYKKNFDFVITMDTDLAHHPKYIINFFMKKNFHVCIGSRYLKKFSTPGWDKFRVFLSYSAHYVSSILYKIKFDTTNGFRCYDIKKININFFSKLKNNKDYDFFQTSAVLMSYKKFIIKEFPMKIHGRITGNSKMMLRHVLKSIVNMINIYFTTK